MHSELLVDPDQIIKAKQLVYSVYVGGSGWRPEKSNPSEFRIESPIGLAPYMEDRFSKRSRWIGIFIDEVLVATCRLLQTFDKKLEVGWYLENLVEKVPILDNSSIEINRFAIVEEHQTPAVFSFLIRETVNYSLQLGASSAITTVRFPNPGNLFLKLGMEESKCAPFKYAQNDQDQVTLLYFNLQDKLRVQRLRSACESMFNEG